MNLSHLIKSIAVLVIAFASGIATALADPWSFGVIADSQWSAPDDHKNPNSVAADIIQQIDREFIAKDVRFVVAVGDTVDKPSPRSLATRALYAQDLYNAGIALYPLRGNHEAKWAESGPEFARVFPQIGTGLNNNTPADITPANTISALDLATNPPAAKSGSPFRLGTNFSAPATNETYHSVSYSFDYEDTRFVLIDQFGGPGATTITEQQEWLSSRLADPKRPLQAFVFGHEGIIGHPHKDTLFTADTGGGSGSETAAQEAAQNRFYASLAQNRVHLYISGHDHHYNESVLTSPDGKNSVRQIISASDGSHCYDPEPLPEKAKTVAIDRDVIGYYIYTVDGPRVTMDFYGINIKSLEDKNNMISTTPELTGHWQKLERSGYSLNGKEMIIPQGAPYSILSDKHDGTEMHILSGTNSSTAANCGTPLVKAINTGWAKGAGWGLLKGREFDILSLWGMAELGSGGKTDTYVISMSFDPAYLFFSAAGPFLATRDEGGHWVNAVDTNIGNDHKNSFWGRAWTPDRVLGDYGIDPDTKTAWAVVNHDGEFAVLCGKP